MVRSRDAVIVRSLMPRCSAGSPSQHAKADVLHHASFREDHLHLGRLVGWDHINVQQGRGKAVGKGMGHQASIKANHVGVLHVGQGGAGVLKARCTTSNSFSRRVGDIFRHESGNRQSLGLQFLAQGVAGYYIGGDGDPSNPRATTTLAV